MDQETNDVNAGEVSGTAHELNLNETVSATDESAAPEAPVVSDTPTTPDGDIPHTAR